MKRDYIKEQNLFFKKYQYELSQSARLLWFEIFNLQNSHFDKERQDWCDWVKITKTELTHLMGTKGNRKIYAARDELIDKGLLTTKSEGGRSPTFYHLTNLLELEERDTEQASDDVSQLSVCGAKQHRNEEDLRCQTAPQNKNEKPVCGAKQHRKTDFEVLNSTGLYKQVNITTTLLLNGTTTLEKFYLDHRGIGTEKINRKLANSRLETLIAHGKQPKDFETVILKTEKSDYLQGEKTDSPFRPSLEWMLKEDVFKKILTGYYDDWNLKPKPEGNSQKEPDNYGVQSARDKQYEQNLQADYDWLYNTPLDELDM